ncbi:MAG: hypothetical protein OXP71_07595 [Candidatus Poribacteria bacterium]|nr:hypothetical protein [Candidatus Poribacteria bacterium]
MGRTFVSVDVEVPVEVCYSYVKESISNPKFLAAYNNLHPGWRFSGTILEENEDRRIVIREPGVDSVTRIRHKGWTIIYDFASAGEAKTKVSISVKYGAFLAFFGLTTTKLQSINEALGRIQSLLALEHAFKLP